MVKKTKKQEEKRLRDMKQERPEQLALFFFEPEESEYSNTIELYDAIPKYFWGKKFPREGRFLPPLRRSFQFREDKYKVEIQSVTLKDRDGVDKAFYPSKREEIVEDALRKLATEGKGLFLDDEMGVTFSLYELRRELKRMGHTYSFNEIKDAIFICSSAVMTLKSVDDNVKITTGPLFSMSGLRERKDIEDQDQKIQCFVRFNPLVTQCIKERKYRMINYDVYMSYKRVLARWLHKRMAHLYTQASVMSPYTISLKRILQDSGVNPRNQFRKNVHWVEDALEEMIEKKQVVRYVTNLIYDVNRKNRINDALFEIYPGADFVAEMKKANARRSIIYTN